MTSVEKTVVQVYSERIRNFSTVEIINFFIKNVDDPVLIKAGAHPVAHLSELVLCSENIVSEIF